MFHVDDPEQMRPEERLQEVAAILSRGYARLERRGLAPGSRANESGERERAGEDAGQAGHPSTPAYSSSFSSEGP